ncbi:MAG: hypothetical protein HYS59_02495 [Candidatus Vogelbacteria bacterium]|nr:hypothetical protein [Candidatus Vogelbacteria bacterium]
MKNNIGIVVVLIVIGVIAVLLWPNRAGYRSSDDTGAIVSPSDEEIGVAPASPAASQPVSNGAVPAVSSTPPPSDVEGPSSSDANDTLAPQSGVARLMEFNLAYTDDGFTPAGVSVRTGDTVIFKNTSASPMWVASNFHPIHSAYPGSGISKCGGSQSASIFDMCQSVPSGGSYRFIFTEVGAWGFHNHLRPSHGGTVTVVQ